MSTSDRRFRWRLFLGADSHERIGVGLTKTQARQDATLEKLYSREGSGANGKSCRKSRRGSDLGESALSIPEWINDVHELFPNEAIERIEKDALERYKLTEILSNPEVLSKVQPNLALLKAIVETKHLLNAELLSIAREIVRRVISKLVETFTLPTRQPFLGRRNQARRSNFKIAKNFDLRTTVRRNAKHFDLATGRFFIETPYFHCRTKRASEKWQIVILVDESASMVDSVIHAAVTAAIFHGIPTLTTNLVLFDTQIVDLSDIATDPVETIMKVQLGGGTDIGMALAYGQSLIKNPRRAVVVLITDFYKGAPIERLLVETKRLVESGATLLGLAALDGRANPAYDHETAQAMANSGAHIAAMTPEVLAQWVAERIK